MAESTTVIAALKFQGGVVIAADSQTSDPNALVKWQVDKLERIGQHPLVVGFSGSGGMGQRARKALHAQSLRANTFKKPELIQGALDRALQPVYEEISKNSHPPTANVWEIGLWGLVAFVAGGEPHILEREVNGDSYLHECFHAIGSGAGTAYAVYRTLGGQRLAEVGEAKALPAMLRILRTCVNVEMWGVSEPLSLFVLGGNSARALTDDELQAHLQAVDEWEEDDRNRFFDAKA